MGLSNASLNDKRGKVAGFDEAKHRYTVRLEGGNEVAVKPMNVRQVIAQAYIDLTRRTFKDPTPVVSAVYDTPSAHYLVSGLPDAASPDVTWRVKPECIELPAGTRVNAVGLTGRPELNGQPGKLLGSEASIVDDTDWRYIVEMAATGEQVKLKFGNVVALHGYNPYVGQF